jgi:hypothetical protein
MRKSLTVALLVPALAISGCTLFGGGRAETAEVTARRTSPLVIPRTFTLPPPSAAATTAPKR